MEASVFGLHVEVPVRREVVVTDDGAEDEEGFGAWDAPSAAGDVEPVGDEVAAGWMSTPLGGARSYAHP